MFYNVHIYPGLIIHHDQACLVKAQYEVNNIGKYDWSKNSFDYFEQMFNWLSYPKIKLSCSFTRPLAIRNVL